MNIETSLTNLDFSILSSRRRPLRSETKLGSTLGVDLFQDQLMRYGLTLPYNFKKKACLSADRDSFASLGMTKGTILNVL